MRLFSNLFRIKTYKELDVIFIGQSKFIFTKLENLKSIQVLIDYAKVNNYLIFIVDYITDIYMYDEEVFNLGDGFVIIYK
jgi:hypothetical protein